MYNQLFEKLMEAAVVTTNLQKEVKAAYEGESRKLELSTWPSKPEGNQYKFWLLTDGTVIPVTRSHRETVENVVDGYWPGDPRIEFLKTGAAAGYFSLVSDEMGVEAEKKLTIKQISALKNLYLDYKVSILYADVGRIHFSMQAIDSVRHLDYLLTYGKDIEEDLLLEKGVLDIWLNHPDMFEVGSTLKYKVKMIPLNRITEVAWAVTRDRKEIEGIFRSKEKKLPLILVEEKGNGDYELHDGQHRYAAYVNVFPNMKYIKAAVFKKVR